MRFVPNLTSTIIANIEQSDASVQTALQQVSTGLRVNLPSDDPTAAAAVLQLQAQSADIDQYTTNADSALTQAQGADTVITSVVALLNKAITLGTQGADSSESTEGRQGIAASVQSLLASVVSLANTSSQGVSLFGGTTTGVTPFTADATSSTGYTYNGNSGINQVQVGQTLSVQANIPGDSLFTNASASVLGSLSNLAAALTSGTSADIGTATTAITSALSYVSEQHVVYGSTINELTAQESFLASDKVTLTSQADSLVGIDTASAAENLTHAETANSAVLAASGKVLQTSLLNYLPN